MFDKVKFWIDRAIAGEQYPAIANHLDAVKQITDVPTGEVVTSGSLSGLKVLIRSSGILVVGSLPKFLYDGSNFYPLDRHTTAEAVDKIADTLHIAMSGALVISIEFGTIFPMMHPISRYLMKLGDIPRMVRKQTESTLYYTGKSNSQPKVYTLYDKIADAKAKGMDYPNDMQDKNILRFEIRFNGRLKQQLRVPEVHASTLSTRPFYQMMVKRYQDIYFSISKNRKIVTNMSEIRTPTDAIKMLFAVLMSQSDPAIISEFMEELKSSGTFTDRKYYSRVKNMIKELSAKANSAETDELIKELDDAIKNVGAYM